MGFRPLLGWWGWREVIVLLFGRSVVALLVRRHAKSGRERGGELGNFASIEN